MRIRTTFSVFLIALFLSAACARLPAHYLELNQCLDEHSPAGEEFLVAFAELEDYLLAEELLDNTSRDAYRELLTSTAERRIHISGGQAAPEVRDFWLLQDPGTIGAFLHCTKQAASAFEESRARSLHRLNNVFDDMRRNNAYDDPVLAAALVDASEDEDFEFMLYRSASLAVLIYMMD